VGRGRESQPAAESVVLTLPSSSPESEYGLNTRITRRAWCLLLASAVASAQQKGPDPSVGKDWVCPMDPDYRSDKPGICPRCGMRLVIDVPDRVEYPLEISHDPELLLPGKEATLTLRAFNPSRRSTVTKFEIVHEKLIHLFVLSENLEYFAHIHPALQRDGAFLQKVCLPYGGMYRLVADFYPSGSVPQLATGTLFVAGQSSPAHLKPSLTPCKSENLTATLRLEPEQPIAGLETRLFFSLDPFVGLQPYLGAWAHMLAASEDLIDLLHLHPFLANGKGSMQFNIIFPRTGLYRVWTQVQRENVVNTVVFTIPVKALS
jgi:Heavy metal binding domain